MDTLQLSHHPEQDLAGQRRPYICILAHHGRHEFTDRAGSLRGDDLKFGQGPRKTFIRTARCYTRRSRPRCTISTACCSAFLIRTKRIVGRVTASHIASASAASFLPRLT